MLKGEELPLPQERDNPQEDTDKQPKDPQKDTETQKEIDTQKDTDTQDRDKQEEDKSRKKKKSKTNEGWTTVDATNPGIGTDSIKYYTVRILFLCARRWQYHYSLIFLIRIG